MELVIYWDSLFLLNFIMNYWILRIVVYQFSIPVKRLHIAVAALIGVGGFLLCLCVIPSTKFVQLLEIGISIPLMVLVILPKGTRNLFWKVLLMGFFYSFLLAGIMRAIFGKANLFGSRQIHISAVITIGFIVVEGVKAYLYAQKKERNQRLFDVKLKSEKDTVCVTALLDTGNGLVEPISQKPVCLIESALLEKLIDEKTALFRVIPYRSVGCEQGVLYAVEVKELQITYAGKEIVRNDIFCAKVLHKLSTSDAYHMILHPAILKEI